MTSLTKRLNFVACTCFTAEHFLRISEDWDDPEVCVVEFVSSRDGSFWRRLKWAAKHVFGRQELVFADIYVKRDEILAALERERP